MSQLLSLLFEFGLFHFNKFLFNSANVSWRLRSGKSIGQNNMSPKLQLMTLASLLTVAGCLPQHNITVPAPKGFFNHGKNDLICVPIKWYDILFFFSTNYIAHAATVRSRPGQKFRHAARDFIFALAYPYSGLLRALNSFLGYSRNKPALTKAYHAGALWVVKAYGYENRAEDGSASNNSTAWSR